MFKRAWLVLLLVMALVATGCSGGDDDDDAAGDDDSKEQPSGGDGTGWTVLQYQIADTNLEPFMMEDVNEMGAVGSNDNLTIRALIDRAEDYGDDEVLDLGSWSGAKLVQINQGSGDVLEDMGPVDTGDPDVLRKFIADGIEASPAEHYALFLSDHGASWPGVGGDESAEYDSLSLEEIHSAVEGGLADAGVDKLDIIGFDACLMATYEVASNLASVADRMIASSELEPGHGWDYNALQVAADDPDTTPDELGSAIVQGFMAQAKEQGTDANVTLALLDLTQMDEVNDAVAAFTSAIEERGADIAPTIGRVRPDTYSYGRSPDPSQDTFMTDMGDLAARIGIEALDVSDVADALQQAINDAVVDKVSGPEAEAFTGLSVYFPPKDFYSPDYDAISTPGDWSGLLLAFYGAGDAIPEDEQAALTNVDDTAEVTFEEDGGLTITGSFDPAIYENLADAYITYGLLNEDGSITYFGDESATFSEDGVAEGFFDLTNLTITDGEDTAVGYLSLTSEEDDEGFTVDVPMSYYAPDDPETPHELLLELVVDGEGTVTQETYYEYNEEAGTYGEATVDPAGIIVPELQNIDAEGNEVWVPTTDVGLFADIPNLLYDVVPLESGTQLFIQLIVEDFGGNTASVQATVTIP